MCTCKRKTAMIRQILSTLLSSLLILGLLPGKAEARAPGAQGSKAEIHTAQIKEQIAGIPLQTYVRVRLQNGEDLRGRLSNRSENEFELQSADTLTIKYSDVKSVKVLQALGSSTNSWATRRLLVGVAVVGAILGIAFWAASQLK